ncbi:hypothetical protein H0W32_00445 [Patescibacteria group bacterium]|nr:hypothetical protein [Patescibacteria group bacterium]
MCPRVQELIRSVNFICFEEAPSEKDFKKAEIYLKSYNTIFPINLQQGIEAYYLSSYIR